MASKKYDTVALTLEEAKAEFGDVQNTARWGFKFKKPPTALGEPPAGFYVGFQTGDFPQEVIAYIEERIGNFPVSWIGEVTRAGSISMSNIESEKLVFTKYLTRWINLMGEVDSKSSTHKSVATADIEATVEMFLLDGQGNKTISFDLKYAKPESLNNPSGSNSPAALQSGMGLKFDTFYKNID